MAIWPHQNSVSPPPPSLRSPALSVRPSGRGGAAWASSSSLSVASRGELADRFMENECVGEPPGDDDSCSLGTWLRGGEPVASVVLVAAEAAEAAEAVQAAEAVEAAEAAGRDQYYYMP